MKMSTTIKQIQVELDRKSCEIMWEDGHLARFQSKWLRFNCQCNMCSSDLSSHYSVDIAAFPDELHVKKATLRENKLILQFEEEVVPGHVGSMPGDWLRSFCYCDQCLEAIIDNRDVIKQDKNPEKVVPTIDYDEIVVTDNQYNDKGLFKWCKLIVETGFCVMKNLPDELGIVEEVASKLGPILPTVYGRNFDVIDTGKVNAAYTSAALPFHQDQNTYETAPGVQFLHAYRFDSCVQGGESLIVDLFHAAEILRREAPDDFQTFAEVPGCWGTTDFKNCGIRQEVQKTHIQLDYFGKIVGVNWGPELSSTIRVRGRDVDRYYKAWKAFNKIVDRRENQFRFKLEKGDLLAVNNRRMAHARESYHSNGGLRHLQGMYSNIDELKNTYLVLAHQLGHDVTPPKIGNNTSL